MLELVLVRIVLLICTYIKKDHENLQSSITLFSFSLVLSIHPGRTSTVIATGWRWANATFTITYCSPRRLRSRSLRVTDVSGV